MTRETKEKERQTRTGEWLPEFTPASDIIKYAAATQPQISRGQKTDDYYGVPLLKKPKWRWQIALYFFFEGISAGSFLTAALSDFFGGNRYRDLTRAGYYTSLLALLPCPPLLVADLGRPERFHHMLRVFKPSSPMNLGAWALSAYSLPATILAARQLIGDGHNHDEKGSIFNKLIPARSLSALGMPLSLTMLSYPGVLLSTTSTPVWSRSRFLGALMACSSFSNGMSAISFLLAVKGTEGSQSSERLEKLESIAGLCEGGVLAAYLITSEDAAQPLLKGRYAKHIWLGAIGAGLVLPALIRTSLSFRRRKQSRAVRIIRSALSLAGGLALKWAVTHAGRESALDTKATRNATRPSQSAPGWATGNH
jgi:formate-dependent nitrite reductase membrane component NrfD